MAHAPEIQAEPHATRAAVRPASHAPVTPGKVAIWLFLATEIMFFTGLIGSYLVLRAGSPNGAYSNLFPPATDLKGREDASGVKLLAAGNDPRKTAEILRAATGATEHDADLAVREAPHGVAFGIGKDRAIMIADELKAAGASAIITPLRTENWPKPYDGDTNPLSIDLTAANTFILICSSVTMVFALSSIQQGKRWKTSLFLLATFLIGGLFLSIQVYEYYQLMFGHHYPPGVSRSGHFRPDSSLFSSTFFTMTGFHGAHVAAGVIAIGCIFLRSLFGGYTKAHHAPIEIVGLYWHFVDLVWIILFTVVYLI